MLLKSHFVIKCHSQSDSFIIVPPIVKGGDWECIVRDQETIMIIVLLAFNIIHLRVTLLTNLPEVRLQGLCYCNSNAWGSRSLQSGAIGLTYQLILKNGKQLRGVQ